MNGEERRKTIDEINAKINELGIAFHELKTSHKHVITKKYNSAYCESCDEFLGWWCETSPTHQCNYNQEDGSHDEDNCRYCGEPEERK